jgi:uncharacterized cupredoxin-like copper-binding protein
MKQRPIARGAIAALALFAALRPGVGLAHGGDPHQKKADALRAHEMAEQKSFGIAGDSQSVTRTIEIDMRDAMRFAPDALRVKRGATVRFVVTNSGKLLHEMVLGGMKELEQHAALMRKFPGMEHDEPYMVHVDPGKKGEIVWRFNRAGEFHYACLIPGHFEAGMVGKIRVD